MKLSRCILRIRENIKLLNLFSWSSYNVGLESKSRSLVQKKSITKTKKR